MNHDRIAMLAALNLVKPALATKDLVEELYHCWFDGETLTAYNDADLGIQAPFKSPFKGGIRGALLLGLLSNSRAHEVIFEPEEEGFVLLKAARAKARLAVLDPDRVVYELPADSSAVFKFGEDFVEALRAVLLSVGNDTSIPEKMGVTIIVGKQSLDFYTTDSKTISHIELKLSKSNLKPGDRFILPTAFCEQLLRLCDQGGFLDLQKDIVTARNSDDVFIWARLVEVSDKPLDFQEIMNKWTGFADEARFAIPSRITLALERSLAMLDGLPDEPATFTLADGKIRLETRAEGRGELKDSVDIEEDVPPVTFRIAPFLIKRALGMATHAAMSEKVVYMTNDKGFSYIASTAGGAR